MNNKNNKRLTISAVTPSFNQGEFIEKTIKSVLSQEGDFCIEYIIMDGGSTDGSVEIIKKYENLLKEGRWPVRCRGIEYRWVSEKDRGQTDAINKGLARATGDILFYVNSDDIVHQGAFDAVRKAYAEKPEAGLIYGNGIFIDEKDNFIRPYHNAPFDMEKFLHSNFICQPSAYITRRAFEVVGFFSTELKYVMDLDMWIRIARRFPVVYIPENLSSLRLHTACKSMADRLESHKEALMILKKHFPGKVPTHWVYATAAAMAERKAKGPRTLSTWHEADYVRHFVLSALKVFLSNYHHVPLKDIVYLTRNFLYSMRLFVKTAWSRG